jgi:tetratricopeptide (TPR) repeat protein
VNATASDPGLAERFASAWIAENAGGLPGRQCLGLAQAAQGRHADAARTFADAARAGEKTRHPLVPELWGQAGNAALLAGDPKTAINLFTSAIAAAGEFAPKRTSGLLVDRARAAVDAGDPAQARRDLDRARALAPEDPHAAMLSAALARREGDLGRAQRDIAAASAAAPADPDIMFEQANIAEAAGDPVTAKRVWEMVVRAAPGTEAARLAAARLKP